ncbi:DUF2441 domain-containing protein [Acidiluteibacter ferrifornacis]|uniref:DUF2441 domain-containing protein n=1 Tax=Acidiluteibacter ferrifornacis TaxID=2692424 RepID=A0A6N9NK48_9FLAO|nr:DUF2441 domain-containing protein [Acidiluteibacter ferrifornacis]NBG67066.1 DUF2441 domain-containing protein [Acidiluteibacter ferrifornacis]
MTKRYFHIQKRRVENQWEVGSEYTIGSKLNTFYSEIVSSCSLKKELIETSKSKVENRIHCDLMRASQYEIIANDIASELLQYIKWIREEIFENIRKSRFPELPSRQQCIWLCTEEHLNYWLTQIHNEKRIFEVKLIQPNTIHKASASYIKCDTYPISEFEDFAEKYWSGENCDVESEILFSGRIKLLSEVTN